MTTYRCPHCDYWSHNVELATMHITRHKRQLFKRMVKSLSEPQKSFLARVKRNHAPYMPYADEQRTADALARRGLVEYVKIENGARYNGYVLTDAGRKATE